MIKPALLDSTVMNALLFARHGEPIGEVRLDYRRLHGGLCSAVWSVTARFEHRGERRRACFVVKLLEGAATREALVYRGLKSTIARSFSPEVLRVEHRGEGRILLCLERLKPVFSWPWRDTLWAARVLDRLARLHQSLPSATTALPAWDYEVELRASAQALLGWVEVERRNTELSPLRKSLPALRRIVSALPELRRQLLAFQPFGSAVIHGDAHPGNVIIRRRDAHIEPVLLDWGRARLGSPLEDVSSWLQSLGCWEPEARRRHDTLLGGYLAARGLPAGLTRSLRDAYWLAAASNVLSGALLHELSTALRLVRTNNEQGAALHAATTWLRVIRRADACWR